MANIDGAWACTVSSPMGPQALTFRFETDGGRCAGTASGQLGTLVLEDGVVDGDTIRFKLKIPMPMPMTLDGQATIAGDALTGTVTAGVFGSWPITGARS